MMQFNAARMLKAHSSLRLLVTGFGIFVDPVFVTFGLLDRIEF